MIFLSFDKAGAEWVVVAYLTGDARMIEIVETGKNPHVITGHLISKLPNEIIEAENDIVGKATDPVLIRDLREKHFREIVESKNFVPRTMSIYQCGKKSNHGLNYDEGYRQFALINEMEEAEAKEVVNLYRTVAYPNIPIWHESIKRELKDNRTLTNCFGRKVRLLGPWGDELFKQGYAFKPQSTVVDMVNQGMVRAFNDEGDEFLLADLLMQVHDELIYQYPTNQFSYKDDFSLMAKFSIKLAYDYMTPQCSYNGRDFKVKTDLKMGLNLGEERMMKVSLSQDINEMRKNLIEAWKKLHDDLKEAA